LTFRSYNVGSSLKYTILKKISLSIDSIPARQGDTDRNRDRNRNVDRDNDTDTDRETDRGHGEGQ
jgi:hypothetical protein